MIYAIATILIASLYLVRLSTKKKQECKFKYLGDLAGRNKEYVTAVLGEPDKAAILVNGTQLLHWQCKDNHISIVFDGEGNFLRVSNRKINEAA